MTIEMPISPENPRTEISFFDPILKADISTFDSETLLLNLEERPILLPWYMHELWRVRKDRVIYDAFSKDSGESAQDALSRGVFVMSLGFLTTQKNETIENCRLFLRDAMVLIDKVRSNIPFEVEVEPRKVEFIHSMADFLITFVKKIKKDYNIRSN